MIRINGDNTYYNNNFDIHTEIIVNSIDSISCTVIDANTNKPITSVCSYIDNPTIDYSDKSLNKEFVNKMAKIIHNYVVDSRKINNNISITFNKKLNNSISNLDKILYMIKNLTNITPSIK